MRRFFSRRLSTLAGRDPALGRLRVCAGIGVVAAVGATDSQVSKLVWPAFGLAGSVGCGFKVAEQRRELTRCRALHKCLLRAGRAGSRWKRLTSLFFQLLSKEFEKETLPFPPTLPRLCSTSIV